MSRLNHQWISQLPIKNIKKLKPVSGGDINEAYQITTDSHQYFMKVQPHKTAKYFGHEINGLKAMSKAIRCPKPLYNGQINGDAYLVLNWVNTGFQGSQAELGQLVAKLHSQTNDRFGFVDNHETGALNKTNNWDDNWSRFYVEQRLEPEIDACEKLGRWNKWRQQHMDHMISAFQNYYQEHSVVPSLCHGDLWSGNYMFDQDGHPLLIDPDAVYADREYDLAMTTIFGGFDSEFYQAYQQTFPFGDGFRDRLQWYRFFYLCLHLILFGETYGGSVDAILGGF